MNFKLNSLENRTHRTKIAVSAVLISFAVGRAAFASEGGSAHGGPSLGLLWLNFVIYIAVMYRLLKKPLATAWATRRESIESRVLASDRDIAEAKRAYDETVEESKSVDSKVFEIMKQSREVANAEAAAIVSGARDQATRIYNQSRMLADVEASRAFRQLQLELGEQIITKANQALSARIDAFVDRQIRSASIDGKVSRDKSAALKELSMH